MPVFDLQHLGVLGPENSPCSSGAKALIIQIDPLLSFPSPETYLLSAGLVH